ncbi:MAG: flagellar biosynthesis protein FlhB [Alphaproteobacteria bacterium CG11_big_fil_rev_8_21_14_0_20_44_7]|nr:MAG: flagellar biosynthesis protein FlhB [Alphaproteobacteria bacterium CG11_big_fil_rev_8_21_14_0_20_44_7]
MSDDDQEKTEEPTQKKLDDSRKKGQIAFSREVSNFFMILTFTICIGMLGKDLLGHGKERLTKYFTIPAEIMESDEFMSSAGSSIFADYLYIIGLPFLLLVIAAITSSVVQNGFHISGESIKPKLNKISPKKGLGRMFSARSLAEFVKGIIKIIIVGLVAFFSVISDFETLENVSQLPANDLMQFISILMLKILVATTIAVFLIAIIDFVFQKQQHIKQLRMSKQEIKDEYKQQEGDPVIKSKLREIRMQRARQRMMQAVPTADVVITNPTHYAIALKYEQNEMEAPKVVAMGKDNIAQKIKEIANENEVPIVRNAPLARSLYDDCELDEAIPLDHYQAVAEVISYVYRMKSKKKK